MNSPYSIVEFFPDSSGSSCGYCKSSDGSISKGMWAHTMTVDDYQALIDRGWRRSGNYCYKPNLTETCCPLYTIRCDALNLKLSKSQKKLLKRIARFLKEGVRNKGNEGKCDDSDAASEGEPSDTNIFDKYINIVMEAKSQEVAPTVKESEKLPSSNSSEQREMNSEPHNHVETNQSLNMDADGKSSGEKDDHQLTDSLDKKCLKTARPGIGVESSKPSCKKAKLIRMEKKKKKLEEKGIDFNEFKKKKNESGEKSLENFINDSYCENAVNKLELKLVRSFPRTEEFDKTFELEHSLYRRYQLAVHKDPITKLTEHQFTRFLISSPLKIRLVPSKCGKDLLQQSWKLFSKYQKTVHKESEDDCDYDTFNSFLVSSPLHSLKPEPSPDCLFKGFGSYHQQYWLNGKLIAVGVIDILPKCVSSVYFFYDPDYSFLSLGTYGSLRELALVRSLKKIVPSIEYYYLGFYIHTCPKMRYKSKYSPSFLLCPEVYTWHSVPEAKLKLDRAKYARLNDDIDAICEDNFINLNMVLVLWKQVAMQYSSYKIRAAKFSAEEDEEVREYAELVGRSAAERMLLYRS